MFWPGLKAFTRHSPSSFTCHSENVSYISCHRCNCLYIGETERPPGERFSEQLRSFQNRSRGFPVAQHFNSATHSVDDITVCGLKQCSGSNISHKQHEMKLIFKLSTLRPNGLNINFNFLWLCFQRVFHIRALKMWFSYVAARLCLLCTSYAHFPSLRTRTVVCMAWLDHSTYWRRAKPKMFNLQATIWHFSEPFEPHI